MTDALLPAGSVFADDWLALREPVDRLARAAGLADLLSRDLKRRGASHGRAVDLGTGTGANLRYLAPRLPRTLQWTLVDHDAGLVAGVAEQDIPEACGTRVDTRVMDLASPLDDLLNGAALVTGSALLDLVSAEWIDSLVAVAARERARVLFALSVDGSIRFHGPADDDDAALLAALARDQRRDKGLGSALGIQAPSHLINALAGAGYAVTAMPAVWWIDDRHTALAEDLLAGWADAARTVDPDRAATYRGWVSRRQADIAAGRTRLSVGHVDVLGLPGVLR